MHPIASILKNLRVPDLPYRLQGVEKEDDIQKNLVLSCLLDPVTRAESHSALKSFREIHPKESLLPKWFNSLFLADRLVDVYLRKNDFSTDFQGRLSQWRFALAYIFVYLGQGDEKPENFAHLLRTFDAFAKEYIGYSAAASRGKFVVDAFERLNLKLFIGDLANPDFQKTLFCEIETEFAKNTERREKIVQRLIDSEKGLARSEYAGSVSLSLIVAKLDNRLLPESVCEFVREIWSELIRQKVLAEDIDAVPASIQELTANLFLTFAPSVSMPAGKKQELAASLVDALEKELVLYTDRIPDYHEHLGAIQRDAIDLLQGKEVQLVTYTHRTLDSNRSELEKKVKVEAPEKYLNAWIEERDSGLRHMVSLWMPLTNTYLMTNLLGMKTGNLRYSALMSGVQTGAIKRVGGYVPLEAVIDETVRGLFKVVSAQLAQRRLAIEKAKHEAELIRAAKKKSDDETLEAKRLVREETERLLALEASEKAAAEEKTRRLKELQITETLTELRLGAWMEFTRRGELEKGKLAVKTKATQKLIFVDKLGLNRFEIRVDEMVVQVMAGEARILDSGAAFDESLERTVSRIRMSAK